MFKGKGMTFNPTDMRARFHQLAADIVKVEAKSTPKREARDKFAQDSRAKEDIMNAEIKKLEDGLYDLKVEQAMISRALGGKTGQAS